MSRSARFFGQNRNTPGRHGTASKWPEWGSKWLGRLLYGPMQALPRNRRRQTKQTGSPSIFRRFHSENMMQTSSALAFTTLMALVPLVAVVLAVASAVPYLDLLVNRLDLLIREALLPSGAAGAIAGNIGKFSHKAQQWTWAGIGLLSVTAFLLMNTIERAFNRSEERRVGKECRS